MPVLAGGADAISEGGTSGGFGITTSGSGTMTAFGLTAGAAAGYNWQSGGWVLGVEADASYVGLNGTQDMAAANFAAVTEHDSFETSWLSTVRGRGGYAWGNWLLYMTAGAAVGDHKYDGVIQAFGIAHPSGDVIKAGWTVGIGSEWMFAPGWSAKFEYLFADLGSETFTANVFANKVSVTGHLTEDMVRFGLNYKLGR
jgi:outer membrane immunogenic protein